ncbi:MAG: WD40/YVTN/BNR-like repeat-containing protein [Planctomycetota bacterium]
MANHMLDGRFVRGGLFRSDDGGQAWRMILEDDFVEGLAVDPRNADVVYAGLWDAPYHDECTGDGIVMTRDGGKTWSSINGTGLTCKKVARIVVDPHNPNRLYLGTTGNGVFVGRMSNP